MTLYDLNSQIKFGHIDRTSTLKFLGYDKSRTSNGDANFTMLSYLNRLHTTELSKCRCQSHNSMSSADEAYTYRALLAHC